MWRRKLVILMLAGLLLPWVAIADPAGRPGGGPPDRRDIPSGTLIIPGAEKRDQDLADKKCMKVCMRWGEDCIIDERRGVRQCRRSCQEFGEQCF